MTDALDDLQKRLKDLKGEVTPPESAKSGKNDDSRDAGKGYELIGTPVVAAFIGISLDKLFSTSPVFFLIFAVLGVCAAFWSIMKAERNIITPIDSKRLQQGRKPAMKSAISDKDSEN